MQRLITPHFNYCNSLFTDLSVNLAQRLQHAHNACVRYICNIRQSDHVTPSLEKLSWLRLRERRTFHSLSLFFNILNTSTPSYLWNRLNRIHHFHKLGTQSQHWSVLSIPSHNTAFYYSSFRVSLARTWNFLPLSIRDCRTLSELKNKLKVYLLNNQLTFHQ